MAKVSSIGFAMVFSLQRPIQFVSLKLLASGERNMLRGIRWTVVT
jgi:hypothetical protein